MLFKSALYLASCVLLCSAAAAPADDAQVFTATQVYNTIIDEAPFIVKATRVVTWTAGPSTVIAQATGAGIN
ncbi:hypothetical protein C8F01DRAFT_1245226 [Mycena amicta]|nr:hypothetical protein C8F01DRAFT_1245226 [Mycena amicta]